MSVKLMGQVFDLGLSANDKLVLIAVADHADHDGARIFPTIALLAQKTALHPRTIQRALRRFELAGLLVRVADSHYRRPNEYRADFSGQAVRGDTVPGGSVPGGSDDTKTADGVAPSTGTPHAEKLEAKIKSNRQKIKSNRQRARETPWPDDFLLTPERAAIAASVGCRDPAAAFRSFRNYCDKHDLRHARWGAAWRSWIDHHDQYGCVCQPRIVGVRAAAPSPREMAANIAKRWAAEGRVP